MEVTDLRNGIEVPSELDKYLSRRARDHDEYEWWLLVLSNYNIIGVPPIFLNPLGGTACGAARYRIFAGLSFSGKNTA